jgi:CHASE3 domain sensor protein
MSFAGYRRLRIWEFLDHRPVRELGLPALVASLVLFVSAMTLLGASVAELRTSYARVQKTNEALLEIAAVNSDILRIEMTVRGYALSGDENYLVWQQMAQDALDLRVARLENLVADDPDERTDIAKLRKLLRTHESYFDAMAKLVPGNRERVVAEMVEYSKKVKRRPIENLLADMRADETRVLALEQRSAETRVVRSYRYAIGISLIAFLFGALGLALILHDRRLRGYR